MNVTLSLDEKVVEKARDVARRRGTSLNDLIRRFLAELVGQKTGEQVAADLLELMRREPGRSGGRRLRREDAYRGRL
jgi:hypothetical protein